MPGINLTGKNIINPKIVHLPSIISNNLLKSKNK
ncbi:hypothetical protein BOM_0447 [Borrelia miyamotoi FR64b]|nr:hypothetical protein BOM_0447 [Borrelia miyamotoi FR64b]